MRDCNAAERKASTTGIQRVVLLTTRTADWFEQRGFKPAGPAHESPLLPESRRKQVNGIAPPLARRLLASTGCKGRVSICTCLQVDASRGSLLYAKAVKTQGFGDATTS